MITGQKLRAFREGYDRAPVEVAAQMGVARQRIGQIEKQAEVGNDVAKRFVAAVVQLSTPDEPAPVVELQTRVIVDGEEWARW